MKYSIYEFDRWANLSKLLPPWMLMLWRNDRLDDMINMDVFLTGGVGLTNGGYGHR